MANILNPNSAGIDISSKEHYVAVPEKLGRDSIRSFGSFTEDLHKLSAWLKECGVETVAMESTGVYWYHLYTVLLDYGFEVYLVNAYHVKNVPGRKSDISDARWLQQLHSFGLLQSCFQPDNLTRTLRHYVRTRQQIIKQMSKATNRMQKSMEQMNIKLANTIRDIQGKTGRKIIEAILSGERNPEKLAEHRAPGIKASKGLLIKSLNGNWREEHLFNLKQNFEMYNFLRTQLKEVDMKTQQILLKFEVLEPTKEQDKFRKTKTKNQPDFDVEKYMYERLGVKVTDIYGIKSTNALIIFSETGGANLKDKFPTQKQFLSWLNVVPDNKISGGKVISSKVKRKKTKQAKPLGMLQVLFGTQKTLLENI